MEILTNAVIDIMNRIVGEEKGNIERASDLMAQAIAGDGFTYVLD